MDKPPKFKDIGDRLKTDLQALAAEVDDTKRSAGFTAALDAMARFWRYSPFNRLMIHQECPHATRVAGRRLWEKLGRTVKDGAKPIAIIAPKKTGRGFPFVFVEVFDISQTEGADVPALDLVLTGDTSHAALLERAAKNLDIRVVDGFTGEWAQAVSVGGEIRIRSGLAPAERVSVLAHELAHEMLHQGRENRKRRLELSGAVIETEAEAVSYVVLKNLGLPSKAPAYIAWRGGSGDTVLKSISRIQRAVKAILTAAIEKKPRKKTM